MTNSKVNNIVLVHGGFVDGSGWESVYAILKTRGFNVSIVQNPTISLADDVAVTNRIINAQDGPVVLVGHSYGGAVITEAGNNPKVRGPCLHHGVCVWIMASRSGACSRTRSRELPYLRLCRRRRASFSSTPKVCRFLRSRCRTWTGRLHGCVSGSLGTGCTQRSGQQCSWKSKPTWYLVATDDKMIPPNAQRSMAKRAGATVKEAKGSHAIYVSQPEAVADLIAQAAERGR